MLAAAAAAAAVAALPEAMAGLVGKQVRVQERASKGGEWWLILLVSENSLSCLLGSLSSSLVTHW
jgi:hypothetical protein